MMKSIFGLAAALSLLAAPGASRRRTIPNRPCAFWSAFRPAPRRMSRRASSPTSSRSIWGKPVVVENISGASGNIAADRAAKAQPDGYTLFMGGNSSLIMSVSLYDKLSFDPVKDFVPITQIFVAANLLVVHPDLPVKSIAELVALAKAKPGELTYGHTGVGSSQHLAGELFKYMTKTNIQPYRLSRLDRGAARPAGRAHHDGLHQCRQRRAAGERG